MEDSTIFFSVPLASYSAPDSFDISYGSKLDESGWHLLLLLAGETEPWRVNTCEHAAPINWQRSCEWHKNCARSKMEQVRQEAKHLFLFEKKSDLEWAVIEPNGPPDWQNHDLIFRIHWLVQPFQDVVWERCFSLLYNISFLISHIFLIVWFYNSYKMICWFNKFIG